MSFEAKVVGIPLSVDDDALHDFFSRFGPLADIRREGADDIMIVFENAEDLADALQVSEFEDGTKITVTRVEAIAEVTPTSAEPSTATTPATAGDAAAHGAPVDAPTDGASVTLAAVEARAGRDARKVRIAGLAPEDLTAQLREMFSACGELADFFYRPRAEFAFVGYHSSEAVMEALKLNGREVAGKAIEVELKRVAGDRKGAREAPQERNLERRVVVKRIGSAPDAEIREIFTSCGAITDFFINRRSDVCFLEFATKEACDAAIAKTGAALCGRTITVERREKQRCFECNQEGHLASQCPKRKIVCRDCGRSGHIARNCPSPRGDGGRSSRRDRDRDRDSRRHRRSRSRSGSRDRRRRHRRDDSDAEEDRPRGGDRRRSRRSPSFSPSRSPSRSRSPTRKIRRRERSRTPPRARK